VNHYQDNWSELLLIINFAATMLPHESTGLSPSMIEFDYQSRTSFDWKPYAEGPMPATEHLNSTASKQDKWQNECKMPGTMPEVW
jgi:hypothetical protein